MWKIISRVASSLVTYTHVTHTTYLLFFTFNSCNFFVNDLWHHLRFHYSIMSHFCFSFVTFSSELDPASHLISLNESLFWLLAILSQKSVMHVGWVMSNKKTHKKNKMWAISIHVKLIKDKNSISFIAVHLNKREL